MDIRVVSLVVFFVLAVLFLKFYASHSYTKQQPAPRLPPGPWQLPLIGCLHHFLLSRFRDLPHRAIHELSKTYGPLMLLRLGTVPTVVVSSAEVFMEMTKFHDVNFCSRHLSPTADIISCGGQNIAFSPYNERWRELRKICTLNLLSQRRVVQFRQVREDEVARLIQAITSECSGGQPIDLGEKIVCMVNNTVVRAAIGGQRCKHQDEFLHEIEHVFRLLGGFNLVDLYPSSKLIRWFSSSARDIDRCQKRMYHILESVIQERATTVAAEQDDDLLGVLLRLQKDGGMQFALTNESISAVIFDIFSAGSDTSSYTLQWAISELIKNPRVLLKAQSEVRDTFKGQHVLTEDNMVKLSYMHMVIKETLRGSAVAVNVWAIGRDSKYWNTPEEFQPERFENSGIDFKGTDFEFVPFGAGRRICPGMALGLANMELALASLLYHFDWKLPAGVNNEELDMTEAFGLTIKRKSKILLHGRRYISFST
ncbi:hypothetical protein EJB05_15826, partial [Eragrostis curvula]